MKMVPINSEFALSHPESNACLIIYSLLRIRPRPPSLKSPFGKSRLACYRYHERKTNRDKLN